MRRTGGLAVSRGYEVDDARPELARQRGRVVFTANGSGLAGPEAADVGRGRVTFIRPNDHLRPLLKGREDIQDFRVGREANDNRMSVSQKLRVLGMVVYRAGQTLVAVSLRQFDRKPGR